MTDSWGIAPLPDFDRARLWAVRRVLFFQHIPLHLCVIDLRQNGETA